MRVRVVSWNVHGCVGGDRRFDPARTAAALAALAPDVALLQEVGDNRGIHPPVDQATALGSTLGLTCAVGITMRASLHGYGNATLSRFAVLDSESVDLSVRGREPRLCLRTVVGRDALRLVTLNVHLGLAPGERRRQLTQLLPAIADGEEPLVMGGDFNDFPPGPVSFTLRSRLLDAGARLARPQTWPSRFPLLRLDRLYLSRAVRLVSAHVDRSAAFRAASDHLPVVVDLDVPESPDEGATDPP
ncbi:MAG TPA: endonuclease/exonuclease/phosphatase family protein [Polyangia bacterium]|nr:endonuclease/exonuclease/phosphatase family protein [Polyangia bacterium]